MYDMLDAAMKVCREGLKQHPNLVSGRIVMARIHMKRGNWEEAEAELNRVLSMVPENRMARSLVIKIEELRNDEHSQERTTPAAATHARATGRDVSWDTVTMAGIFASQGHYDKARDIYRSILDHDPGNEAAQRGIAELP